VEYLIEIAVLFVFFAITWMMLAYTIPWEELREDHLEKRIRIVFAELEKKYIDLE
jgi:hypothetical protein